MVFGSQSKLPPRADVSSARRLLKYWDGSRVEAEGRMARSEGGASPAAGCNDRATPPAALLPRAVHGCDPSQYFNSLLMRTIAHQYRDAAWVREVVVSSGDVLFAVA